MMFKSFCDVLKIFIRNLLNEKIKKTCGYHYYPPNNIDSDIKKRTNQFLFSI
jgi:hypothetical protein